MRVTGLPDLARRGKEKTHQVRSSDCGSHHVNDSSSGGLAIHSLLPVISQIIALSPSLSRKAGVVYKPLSGCKMGVTLLSGSDISTSLGGP